MRLRDYLIRPVSTSTEPSGQYNLQLEAYNLAVNLINRMTHPIPTVCDIDAIRQEIEQLPEVEYDGRWEVFPCWKGMKEKVLNIIDSHTKGEKE